MSRFAVAKAAQQGPESSDRRRPAPDRPADGTSLLRLQATCGNQAVLRMLGPRAHSRARVFRTCACNGAAGAEGCECGGKRGEQAGDDGHSVGSIQAKLTVSQPGDLDEEQADRTADVIMRSADVGPPRGPQAGVGASARQQRRSAVAPLLATRIDALRSKGSPLPSAERAFFEARFGVDFGAVRVHVGGEAAAVASELGARAFAVGTDVAFAAGQYAPGTPGGRRLLAHELTHVVQQDGAAREVVQRDALDTVRHVLDPKSIAGDFWLALPRAAKERAIDSTLGAAAAVVGRLPDTAALGVLWPVFLSGLSGFIQRLRSDKISVAEKIMAMDKLARIIAGRSSEFTLGYLKGLARGFFIDGMLGIFIAIYELIKAIQQVWEVIKQVGVAIAGFPEHVQVFIDRMVESYKEILANGGSWEEGIRGYLSDPRKLVDLVSSAMASVKDFANKIGGDLAEKMVHSFNAPGAEKELGETVGNISGQVLWEAVFAAITAGTGVAVTAIKTTIGKVVGVLSKVLSKIVSGFRAVFAEIKLFLKPLAGMVRGAMGAAKGKIGAVGERFAKLLDDLVEFLTMLFNRCHESKLDCSIPGQKKPGASGPVPHGGATAEGAGAEFRYEYHPPVTRAPTPQPEVPRKPPELTDDEKWEQATKALRDQETAAARSSGRVAERFPTPEAAVGQVSGRAKVVQTVRTHNQGLRDQGFTETWYVVDSRGTQWTVAHNPRTGDFTGAHRSSSN